MSIKEIKIRVAGKDQLKYVLEELGEKFTGEIEVKVKVKEDKETLSFLCSASEILDWDFTAGKEDERVIEDEVKEEEVKEISNGILSEMEVGKGDWNGLVWVIEAIWKAAQKSPAVLYQSGFFWKVVKECYSEVVTPEHVILVKLSQIRYNDWGWKEVDEDLTQNLNNVWKRMNGLSLSELAKEIYET
jgi:hypothetical protein